MTSDRDQDARRFEAPLIEGCRLFERVSRKGRRYLTGRLGGLRIVVWEANDGGEHSHVLMFGAAAPPTSGGGGRR
ncbi:hypothetical protein [Falsiroseomonas sp.]|uniref:hypothetical protein n=1 Tax=Falsiroseomonas sp. TaxID=2870721 RepID=UPI0035687F31